MAWADHETTNVDASHPNSSVEPDPSPNIDREDLERSERTYATEAMKHSRWSRWSDSNENVGVMIDHHPAAVALAPLPILR